MWSRWWLLLEISCQQCSVPGNCVVSSPQDMLERVYFPIWTRSTLTFPCIQHTISGGKAMPCLSFTVKMLYLMFSEESGWMLSIWTEVKLLFFFFGYSLWLPLQFALKFSQAVAREFFLFPSEWYLVKPQLLCWDQGLFERWVRPKPSQHLGGKRICGKCQQVILA